MKNISLFLLISLTALSACSGGDELEKLKIEKAEIQASIKDLKKELTEIEASIEELDTTSNNEKLELVTVIKLGATDFNNYIEAQGSTSAEDDVMVTTDMGGLVRAIYVDEGQYVSKGKTLIQLDNSVVLNQIAELETGIALAKDVFDKRKRLWDQNIGSEIEYLQAKNNYESLINSKATISTQLSKLSISSPISGYVDMVNINLGEMASPGMPVCRVVNNKDMEVQVDLPESYLGKAKKGDKIFVEIPALEMNKEATIKSVGQSVNQYNRSFQVIASIENKDGAIKPNLMAKVKFSSESIDNSIIIPTGLLQESSKGYFVYIAQNDSASNEIVSVKRQIEVGDSYGGNILVTKGLDNGDMIINKGYRNVLDGQLIKIQE